ncbi:MAG: RagB/SusD family nutrient uptake outer membrane protein [Tenuifilaceae bacterium]|jgi:hypothetical protein|nr:RagB/SusD family nutrient uptake outer membrane protein [Tenuifilaceae bacterium]
MKRLSILALLFSFFMIVSCDEDLEFSPSGSLKTEDAISNVQDLHNAINGVYERLIVPQASLSSDMFVYGDYKGDSYDYAYNAGHSTHMGLTNQTATSDHSDNFYYVIYTALGRANYVLEAASKFSPDAADKATYDSYVSELHAIRGWLHFQAAILFCQIPTVNGGVDINAENTGLVIADRIFPVDHRCKRSTLAETYQFITSELEYSIANLTTGARKGGINQYGAKAILSRVYLYLGDYDNALKYAVDVINNSGASLYSIAQYSDAWSDVYTSEALVELGVTDNTGSQRHAIGYYAHPDGYAEFAFQESFFSYLQTRAGDVRATMISYKTADDGTAGYFTNKYPGQKGSSTPLYSNSPKIIRLSEVYLIAAEAILKGGATTGAQSAAFYINELRKHRIVGYTDVASITIDDVLEERQLELHAEGHRFFDLVRNNRTFMSPFRGIIEPNAKTNLMAFPQREIFISAGSLVQNPY